MVRILFSSLLVLSSFRYLHNKNLLNKPLKTKFSTNAMQGNFIKNTLSNTRYIEVLPDNHMSLSSILSGDSKLCALWRSAPKFIALNILSVLLYFV